MKKELLEQAKKANSPEELQKLAQENELKLTPEEANAYFDQIHAPKGELSDDELDDVSGGGCTTNGGYTVVTSELKCFTGQYQINSWLVYKNIEKSESYNDSNASLRTLWNMNCGSDGNRCGRCAHLEFDGGIGYCGVSK